MAASGPELEKSMAENAVAASSSNNTANVLLRSNEEITQRFNAAESLFTDDKLKKEFDDAINQEFYFGDKNKIEPLFKQFPEAMNQHNQKLIAEGKIKFTGDGENMVLYVDIDHVLLSTTGGGGAINYPLLETLRELKKKYPKLEINILSSMSTTSFSPDRVANNLLNAPSLNVRAFLAQQEDADKKPLFDRFITTEDEIYAMYCQANGLPVMPGDLYRDRLKPLMELLYDKSGQLQSELKIPKAVYERIQGLNQERREMNSAVTEDKSPDFYAKIFSDSGILAALGESEQGEMLTITHEDRNKFFEEIRDFLSLANNVHPKGNQSKKHLEKARLMDWDLQYHPNIQGIAVIDDMENVTLHAMMVAAVHGKAVVGFTPKKLNSVAGNEIALVDKFQWHEMKSFLPLLSQFLKDGSVDESSYNKQLEYIKLMIKRDDVGRLQTPEEKNEVHKNAYQELGILYYLPEDGDITAVNRKTIEAYEQHINETVLPAYNKAARAPKVSFAFGSSREQRLLRQQGELMKAAEHYSPKALLVLAQMLNKGQFLIKNSETGKIERIQKPDPKAAFWLAMLAAVVAAKEIQNSTKKDEAAPWTDLYQEIMKFLHTELKEPTTGNESELKLNQRSPEETARQQLDLLAKPLSNIPARGIEELNKLIKQHESPKQDESSLAASSSGPRQ